MSLEADRIIQGDCLEALASLPDKCVDLIVVLAALVMTGLIGAAGGISLFY